MTVRNSAAIVLRDFWSTDAPVLAEICEASALADGVDTSSTLSKVPGARQFASMANTALSEVGCGFAVVEIDDRVAGYVSIRSWAEEDGTHVYLHDGCVLSALRNRGAGTAIVAWAEDRIREMARTQDATAVAVFGARSTTSQADRTQLLGDNAYLPVFTMVTMAIDGLDDLPEVKTDTSGFALRAANRENVRSLWKLNNIAYAGRAFTSAETEDGFATFAGAIGDLTLYTVAVLNDEIVGFVSSEIHEAYAEVTDFTVHPDYRRRGLATALLSQNLTLVRNRGINRARLHTNGEDVSGARSLYASFGFQPSETHVRYRKNVLA